MHSSTMWVFTGPTKWPLVPKWISTKWLNCQGPRSHHFVWSICMGILLAFFQWFWAVSCTYLHLGESPGVCNEGRLECPESLTDAWLVLLHGAVAMLRVSSLSPVPPRKALMSRETSAAKNQPSYCFQLSVLLCLSEWGQERQIKHVKPCEDLWSNIERQSQNLPSDHA